MPNKSGPIAKPGLHSHANELHWPPPYKAAAANRIPVQPAAKRPGIPNAGSAAQRAQLHWPPPCNLGVKNNQAIRPLSGANAVQAAMRIRPVAAPAPYSAAPLTDNKPRRAPVIQPLLRRYSARSDLAGVFRADNGDPATQTGLDLATTSGPQQYTLPAWSIAIERRIPQGFFSRLNRVMGALTFGDDTHEVYARLTITRNAEQGTNISVYLGTGTYETNMHLNDTTYDDLEQQNPGGARNTSNSLMGWSAGRSRVYVVMPPAIAGQNKLAEEEHLRDFIYAYDRTLRVAQQALEGLRGRTFGPFDNEEEAREAVRAAFLNRVPRPLRRLGMDMVQWGAEYMRLCQKSRSERDDLQWHSFGMERVRRDQLPKELDITYLTGARRAEGGRVYVRMNTGTTQIGQHAPDQVITYD